ncbi:hypothetical protein CRM22_006254 [Opisthorchis felineus]|uniref:tRNA-splicing endonuclease subunit Sen54 N-terminal domain-containing protein n=1 Tax=Opisthorchis felineus TaxID=147828 RepID=A0A4S2LLZ6_OPIFE|nr:hypothetical protein CRM22_006254 [Opisthorchis felineus]TGZ64685.1 hypothetical protein CRM22_006254 [Opisthorchis felineus]
MVCAVCGVSPTLLLQDKFLVGKTLSQHAEPVRFCNYDPARKRRPLARFDEQMVDVKASYSKYFASLAQEHVSTPARVSHGVVVGKLVKLTKVRGKYFRYLGTSVGGTAYLHPEESVFLVQSNRLQIWDRGMPLSVQQVYTQLLRGDAYERYLVFMRLMRYGFVLRIRDPGGDEPRCYIPRCSDWVNDVPTSIPLSHLGPLVTGFTEVPRKVPNREHRFVASSRDIEHLIPCSSVSALGELMSALQSVVKPGKNDTPIPQLPCLLFDGYGNCSDGKARRIDFSKKFPPAPDFLVARTFPDQVCPYLPPSYFDSLGLATSTPILLSTVDGTDLFFHKMQAFCIPIVRI